jgi:hypothetical protein
MLTISPWEVWEVSAPFCVLGVSAVSVFELLFTAESRVRRDFTEKNRNQDIPILLSEPDCFQ